MAFKKWRIADYDKELAKSLAEECNVDPLVALIASSRGYSDPCELEQFLSDEPYFYDPSIMVDIQKAAYIVNESILANEKIVIYGDYDCDGVIATTVLYKYLKSRDADCSYYIPDRFEEGYGMNCGVIENLAKQGTNLIISVDNGVTCIDEINLAKKLGMKVVVTDHHLPAEVLPDADAVVDPNRNDCPSEFKTICGAQVAFALICVIEGKEPEELILEYSDLLTIAIIADIMPLIFENRSIVKCGIEKIKTAPIMGISALLNVAGIDIETINSNKIAFGLAPRINASGRMGKAERAVELLLCENIMTALSIANEIDAENAKRQQIEKKIFEEAISIIEEQKLKYHKVIVVSGEGWHSGVIGIVASKICERYGVPTVMLSSDGETASGSARSIERFSIYDAFAYCKDLITKFGGHKQAAGLTISAENIDKFREKINQYARQREYVPPVLNIDCKLNPSVLSLELAFTLKQLEPFGAGNKTPIFGIYESKLERITPIANNKHLKLLFKKGNNVFQCLLFGVSTESFLFKEGDILDLAVVLDTNYYKGEYSISVQLKGIRLSGIDEDKLFSEISAVSDFLSVQTVDACLLPTREEVGAIYKYISEHPSSEERLKHNFVNSIGFGKTSIAIITMLELGLVTKNDNGDFNIVKNSGKTNLINSNTYKLLIEGSGNNE